MVSRLCRNNVNSDSSVNIYLYSILVSLLVGPYSDKYGRRPLLLVPLIGNIIAQIVYLVNVYYWVSLMMVVKV